MTWRDGPQVEPTRWGKDHYSTIAYAECRAVDNDGVLDARHLRLDGGKWPTRLAGKEEQSDHSDLDCLVDAERAGLLTVKRLSFRDHRDRMNLTYQVAFTSKGMRLAEALRKHKASGGSYGNVNGSAIWPHVAGLVAPSMALQGREP